MKKLVTCKRCSLHKTRTQVVLSDGPIDAKVMFIGEAPGREEDREGIPFCGASGDKLDDLLEIAGLRRKDIRISNLIRCRPPRNRDPDEKEIKRCQQWMYRELAMVRSSVIVPLGRFASAWLLKHMRIKFTQISREHGKVRKVLTHIGPIVILPMFHPASGLYRPNMIPVIEEDFETLGEVIRKLRRKK